MGNSNSHIEKQMQRNVRTITNGLQPSWNKRTFMSKYTRKSYVSPTFHKCQENITHLPWTFAEPKNHIHLGHLPKRRNMNSEMQHINLPSIQTYKWINQQPPPPPLTTPSHPLFPTICWCCVSVSPRHHGGNMPIPQKHRIPVVLVVKRTTLKFSPMCWNGWPQPQTSLGPRTWHSPLQK